MNHWNHYFNEIEIDVLKVTNNLYDKAYYIVRRAFLDKKDRGGNPYIEHLLYVSSQVSGKNAKVVALLHDIIEDTMITKEDLLWMNFPQSIVDSVLLVTKREEEIYEEFIERLIQSNNKDALMVKKADMEHNMDLSRIPMITEEDQKRVEKKYKPNYQKIMNKLNKRGR